MPSNSVRDTRRPVITCPTPPMLTGDGNCQAVLPLLNPAVTDNCGAGGVTLTQSPPPGTVLTGPGTTAVTLTARDLCGNTQSCTVNVTVTCGAPAVQLIKTVYPGHNGGIFCPGADVLTSTNNAPVTYCFEVRNTGAINLSDLELSDASLGLAGQSAGNLSVGQSVMLHAEALMNGPLTNLAQVAGSSVLGQPVSGSDEAVVHLMAPGIELVQTVAFGADAPCPGQPFLYAVNGQPVTYCFQLTNTGDTPLAESRILAPEIGLTPMQAGSLAIGQTLTTSTWRIANGSVTNLATATALPPSGPPVSDISIATTTALGPAGELKKTVYAGHDGGFSCPGGEIAYITGPDTPLTFCFEFRNSGDGTIYSAALSDPAILITDLSLALTLNPGESAYYAHESLASAAFLNTATAVFLPASGGAMSVQDNASAALPAPAMVLEKKAAAGFAGYSGCRLAGQEILALPNAGPVTWCLTVRNTGNTWLSNITLSDAVLGVDESDMEYVGPALPLPPGEEGVWLVTGHVGASLRNQANAQGIPSAPDGTPIAGQPAVQASDSADVLVNGEPIP